MGENTIGNPPIKDAAMTAITMRIVSALYMLFAAQSMTNTFGMPIEEIVPSPADVFVHSVASPKMGEAETVADALATKSAKNTQITRHDWDSDEEIPTIEELEMSDFDSFASPKSSAKEHIGVEQKSSPMEHVGVEQFSEEDNLHDQLHAFQALVQRHKDGNHAACRNPRSVLAFKISDTDLSMAVDDARTNANMGDSGAAFSLGFAYAKGIGVPKDPVQAVYWYEKSAEQKYVAAAINLGVLYLQGDMGIEKDFTKAKKYFSQAVLLGSVHGMHILATIHQAYREHAKAVELFKQGADMGDHHAEFSLGKAYADGRGVTADLQESIRLLTRAANHGNVDAQTNLGVSYMIGKGVVKNPLIATQWFAKAAKGGNPSAQLNLGVAHLYGRGVDTNTAKAAELFLQAARQGVKQAQTNIAILYRQGQGVAKDLKEAAYWTQQANQNASPR